MKLDPKQMVLIALTRQFRKFASAQMLNIILIYC